MARRKQGELPGMEREQIKEVDDAAEAYRDARDARMKKTETEKESKDALIEVMRKHKLTVYRDESVDPPLVITLVDKTNVKVTEVEDGAQDEAA
jgi:hypothetical protein